MVAYVMVGFGLSSSFFGWMGGSHQFVGKYGLRSWEIQVDDGVVFADILCLLYIVQNSNGFCMVSLHGKDPNPRGN
jgi:hypothetical protein